VDESLPLCLGQQLALLLVATPATRIEPLLRKLVKVAAPSLRSGRVRRKAR
jgi:hypothetical protein